MLEIQTDLTLELLRDFNKFQMWYKKRVIVIVMILAFLFLGALNIYQEKIILGIIFIALGLLHPLITYWMMDKKLSKIVNRSEYFKEAVHQSFELDNKIYNYTLTRGEEEAKFNTEWDGIANIYETKKNFYIYLPNKQAHIILKEECLSNIEKLSELFTEVLGNKFKKVGKI